MKSILPCALKSCVLRKYAILQVLRGIYHICNIPFILSLDNQFVAAGMKLIIHNGLLYPST